MFKRVVLRARLVLHSNGYAVLLSVDNLCLWSGKDNPQG